MLRATYLCLLFAGCALDRSGLVAMTDAGEQGSRRDSGTIERDAGSTSFDASGRDASRIDPIDAGARDAGVDAGFDACVPRAESCNAGDDDCDAIVDEDTCACEVEHFGDGTYLFCSEDDMSSVAAAAYCASFGYELLVIEDAAENEWVMTEAFERSGSDWLIGIDDATVEGEWRRPDGTLATYVPFVPPEPNGGRGENCCEIRSSRIWNDCDCNGSRPFVCEAR